MDARAGETGPDRSSGRSATGWPWAVAWALLGLALLTLAAAPALTVPGLVAEERAYLDARPCDSGAARAGPRDTADCLRTTRATVLSAERVRSGKATVLRVRLAAPAPAPAAARRIDLDAQGPLADLVGAGDRLEVTTWRDVQVSVSRDGIRETLPGQPDEGAAMSAALALAVGWPAALAFVAAYGSARRGRRRAAGLPCPPRVPFGAAKLVGVVVVPLAAGFLAQRLWDGWTAVVMTVAVWALVAVPATIAALRWDRDPPRTSPRPRGEPPPPPEARSG
ncbi:hypothetical protein OOK31_08685 [Streptomyces sp. NBC_00249]|uniref:hypothetical protein n=1 Tax=Streptomyces sp. NBC_00249 TaxID=2975690 RepID=UPI00224E34AF|nr:hypothetical protein [Streptomyces sp. NBC_00249]MCX5193972.1 hypothetical protein [Streptomyces sp. NBC_00249]